MTGPINVKDFIEGKKEKLVHYDNFLQSIHLAWIFHIILYSYLFGLSMFGSKHSLPHLFVAIFVKRTITSSRHSRDLMDIKTLSVGWLVVLVCSYKWMNEDDELSNVNPHYRLSIYFLFRQVCQLVLCGDARLKDFLSFKILFHLSFLYIMLLYITFHFFSQS